MARHSAAERPNPGLDPRRASVEGQFSSYGQCLAILGEFYPTDRPRVWTLSSNRPARIRACRLPPRASDPEPAREAIASTFDEKNDLAASFRHAGLDPRLAHETHPGTGHSGPGRFLFLSLAT